MPAIETGAGGPHLPRRVDAVSHRRAAAHRDRALTIPNIITVGRLLLVPMIVWAIVEGYSGAAFILFVVAGVSDGIDGFIARRYDLRSRLGAYLDPLADKALLVSIFLSLTFLGEIPLWLAMIVVSRDLLIIGGVLLAWVLDRPMEVRPLYISKINTAAQIIFAALVRMSGASSWETVVVNCAHASVAFLGTAFTQLCSAAVMSQPT